MFLETSGIGQETIAPFLLPAIRHEDYQLVPVKMALSLPRPRLLIADDVGLGKTIEAGLILSELHARRRANRVLIVCPASLCLQWQREMQVKFGFRFVIFNRQTLAQKRRELEAGTNPWAYEPRIITSMDFLKRPDGAFREIQGLRWDVIIVDEAHHLAPSGAAESDKQLTRLGRFLAEASDALLLLTATPHNGYDESMATLLSFLDPSLVSAKRNSSPADTAAITSVGLKITSATQTVRRSLLNASQFNPCKLNCRLTRRSSTSKFAVTLNRFSLSPKKPNRKTDKQFSSLRRFCARGRSHPEEPCWKPSSADWKGYRKSKRKLRRKGNCSADGEGVNPLAPTSCKNWSKTPTSTTCQQ